MNEVLRPAFDQAKFDDDYSNLTGLTPGIVGITVPEKASKQLAIDGFMSGECNSFHQEYPKIASLSDEDVENFHTLAAELLQMTSNMPELEATVYRGAIETKIRQMNLAMAMRDYNSAVDPEAKADAAERFMKANIELYGEPDLETYRSLLSEKVAKISSKQHSPEAEAIFAELKDLLPAESFDSSLASSRFHPSAETVEWMNQVVHGLFDGMLSHVPDTDELIEPDKLRDIFQAIIDEEFEDEDWTAELKEAKAISVNAGAKRVTVPIDRQPMSVAEVRRLVVHELGIHMLTALTGESTDLKPLGRGLDGYADTQEGLGKVAEQALDGEFKEAGIDHYITAGLAYFDHKDFVGALEVKWRMKLLEDLAENEVPTDEQIAKAKRLAIDGPGIATMRIFRGTDELPLFKDLSYYNGSTEVWKYLESICGDDLQLSLLLAGKRSASKEHQRIVLESRSV